MAEVFDAWPDATVVDTDRPREDVALLAAAAVGLSADAGSVPRTSVPGRGTGG